MVAYQKMLSLSNEDRCIKMMTKNFTTVRMLLFLTMITFLTFACGCNNNVIRITHIETEANSQPMMAQQTVPLPDVKDCASGSGFTCTGLTYSQKDDTFWVGNFGMLYPSDSQRYPSIVQLSKDCTSVLTEIPLKETLSETLNFQGISYDNNSHSLWIADPSAGFIYNVTMNGKLLTQTACTDANGVACDSDSDTLWVINNSSDKGDVVIKNIKKSGESIIAIRISGIYHSDQLYLDEKNDVLYFSAGAQYSGENYVYAVSLTENTCKKAYTLGDSYAIEGIFITDGQLFVCNDGLYHNSTSNTNEMKIYTIAN